jgi:hypothetical protein
VSTVAKKLRKTLNKAISLQKSRKIYFIKRNLQLSRIYASEGFAAVKEDMLLILKTDLQQSNICLT